MEIDPRIDVEPDESCALCGEPLLEENNLVVIESGEMSRMRRDPRFLTFKPDRNTNDPDTPNYATTSIFHFHCVMSLADSRLLDWSDEAARACLCERLFRAEQQVYRLTVGTVDEDTLVFVPSNEDKSHRLVCEECIAEILGDGDLEEGMALLEATG